MHSLSQTWIQIGRNPASALGSIAPHTGSIVALEKAAERTPKDLLPGFISLNAGSSQVGAATVEPGWSRGRDVRNEDIEATVYSALGINWTTTRRDDPFNRGFEYVPYADQDIYGPINELWG